jgi:hypothetical protein
MRRMSIATAFVVTTAMTLLLLQPKDAKAFPCYEQEFWYFDSDQCSNTVGQDIKFCTGGHSGWGDTTPWYAEALWCCSDECDCGGEGAEVACYYSSPCVPPPGCSSI